MQFTKHPHRVLTALVVILLSLHGIMGSAADPVTIQAQVDRQDVAVGESLLLQIKIDGDDSPAEPDLSGLVDFTVQPMGGGQNNRESVTIINGKVNRISEHGYVFRYSLTPKRDGTVTIPALTVTAAGRTLLTQPITVNVEKPQQTHEFKLEQELSDTECYVGQPLVYTATWYVNRNIDEFQFTLPALEDRRFEVTDYQEDRDYSGPDAIAINLQGNRVIARKGQEGQYATVTLRRILIPREPGSYSLEPASVSSRVITGYQQPQGGSFGSPFNNGFFNDMFNRRQPIFKQLLTLSDSSELRVKPLPVENRPQNFSGLVGKYSLAAEASPDEVNVGDPITLNIMVTGAAYLDNVTLPALAQLPGMDDFKVPEEMGQGEINGRVKTFTQTIRARNPSTTEIPAISLTYFDPDTGRYETANSKPIPLKVHGTKVITAMDAEGSAPAVEKSELTTHDKGISYNYVGDDVIENQHFEIVSWFTSSYGLLLLLLPPVAYLLVLIPVVIRRKRGLSDDSLQARGALQEFVKTVAKLEKDQGSRGQQETVGALVEAVRSYLGKQLRLPAGSIVFADAVERLKRRGVEGALVTRLQEILDWCEAYHYGGFDRTDSGRASLGEILHTAQELFREIDTCFRN